MISNHWSIKVIKALGWTAGIVSIGFSIWAVIIAMEAREDARKIAGLHLEPQLAIMTNLNSKQIRIKNLGSTTAIQVEVFIISYVYRKTYKAVDYSFGEIAQFDELTPFEEKNISFSIPEIKPIIKNEIEEYIKAFEIRLVHRRAPDMKQYVRFAYYFLDPDGNWVNETSKTLVSATYDPVRKAIMERSRKENLDTLKLIYDPLHTIDE